jgi:hypothetical protein
MLRHFACDGAQLVDRYRRLGETCCLKLKVKRKQLQAPETATFKLWIAGCYIFTKLHGVTPSKDLKPQIQK